MGLNNEKGQVILLVVLVMVVALSVGLSLVSRNIFQLKTSLEDTDSQKAFTAAEAGIEEALQKGSNITGQSLGNNSSISQVQITQIRSAQLLLNNSLPVRRDEGTDVWLSNYPDYSGALTGKLIFYWGTGSTPCNQAALEIITISSPAGSPIITRAAVDHNDCPGRITQNRFTNAAAGATILGQAFSYSTTINYTNGQYIRVVPLFADAEIGISNTTNADIPLTLPIQGKLITSTGTSGQSSRELTYFQSYQGVPTEFFYSLFQTN